ncbi:hypothetical protein [Xanthocytophaga agilis]|uniref:ExsA-like N-terminal regulatory domain-containing protein n=1 Tax=Xanthocytophaga agilis TaxID=3048010 RepID=A0AAE3QWS6_9BACT|nr:hypothetical protein [Xanthocytophaga agilis]MDJ1499481.1 hypothetical protein [Xanthocytophaga agilis]
MNYTILPDVLYEPSDEKGEISIVPYSSGVPVIKGRSMLKKNMISLIWEGEKIIHYTQEKISLQPDQILLLAAGNYLTTQRFAEKGHINSILIFFDNSVLNDFLEQQKDPINFTSLTENSRPYVLFEKDAYLNQYIVSLKLIV